MVVLITLLTFAAVVFGTFAVVLETQSKRMSDRFTTVASRVIEEDDDQVLRGSLRERVFDPMLQRLNAWAVKLTPAQSVKQTALRLDRAGRPFGLTPATWTLVKTAGMLFSVIGALAVLRFGHLHGPLGVLAALAVAACGALGPSYYLDYCTKVRQAAIRRALPDVIDLLVVSVEAGLGLDAALSEVIARRKGPLLDEFARVLAEVRVGKPRRRAWQDMAERTDCLELKVFTAALVQAEELGASIAGVLRGQSEALRMRRGLSVREVAAVLPVKMLFPLVFFIFPGMFVVILGPGMINMMQSFGQIGF
jgi:tight adherence protein C